jgi:ATP-dependent DNA helicase RecQ
LWAEYNQTRFKIHQQTPNSSGKNRLKYIDTLFLSLFFPTRPYHHLLKDDKLQTEELNNPVNDSLKAKDLFNDEITAFNNLDEPLKRIYYLLLKDQDKFSYFFEYISFTYSQKVLLTELITEQFQNKFCSNAPIETFVEKYPIEFAYCLALINCTDRYSITPPWIRFIPNF